MQVGRLTKMANLDTPRFALRTSGIEKEQLGSLFVHRTVVGVTSSPIDPKQTPRGGRLVGDHQLVTTIPANISGSIKEISNAFRQGI